jgi:hypothetical protein
MDGTLELDLYKEKMESPLKRGGESYDLALKGGMIL